ncbi:oxidoreductase-like domain-containing protein [Chitinibacter tainanensis]|uniref:oxidoreductase-like domain-containing protein n=1 Tax=Chitinibacter tainanensis TaxID=230667 RepID=UPI0023544FC3|nr:oxidoreductase-like domain-containing protein [Chitinibacter tainanensis]
MLNPPADPSLPTAQDDPEPQAPHEPALEECCTSGCVPCIFDIYAEALHAYRAEHLAWRARQAARDAASAGASD